MHGCLSPNVQHFNETINGLLTVRAFQAVPDFVLKSGKTVNDCSRAEMAQNCSPQWLGIRISSLAACSMFLTSLGIVLQPNRLDAGLVGLVLTYANMVNATLQGFLRQLTEVEIRMNGVERVRHFSKEIKQEAPYILLEDQRAVVPARWPTEGKVSFRNVSARYRPELPTVVEGLTIEVGVAEKVGVCGRTGSGKSTLMLLLFRILELDPGGIIEIVSHQSAARTCCKHYAIVPFDASSLSESLWISASIDVCCGFGLPCSSLGRREHRKSGFVPA